MEDNKLPRTNVIDNAYDSTFKKYGIEQATQGLYYGMINHDYKYITADNNSREEIKNLMYSEFFHILADYTISSFSLDKKNELLSTAELNEYCKDSKGELEYDKHKSLCLFASAIASNPFFAYSLMATNKKMIAGVIESFINERYILNKRNILDNANPWIPSSFSFNMTKERLNQSCYGIKKDELSENGPIFPTEENNIGRSI